MKKILAFLTVVLALTGCSIGEDMSNTPTKQVEEYLNNYHKQVYEKISPYLNKEEKEWLKIYTREI